MQHQLRICRSFSWFVPIEHILLALFLRLRLRGLWILRRTEDVVPPHLTILRHELTLDILKPKAVWLVHTIIFINFKPFLGLWARAFFPPGPHITKRAEPGKPVGSGHGTLHVTTGQQIFFWIDMHPTISRVKESLKWICQKPEPITRVKNSATCQKFEALGN